MTELLLGCGHNTEKRISVEGRERFVNVTKLDNNSDHNPDVIWDLCNHPLPFEDNTFDEIHAYEVLEHLAYQGDYKFFFREFSEYWRILKPNGLFCATVPSKNSVWTIGDPSHKRIITKENLIFLNQKSYEDVVKSKMSDFRYIYKADFGIVYLKDNNETFTFVLRSKK